MFSFLFLFAFGCLNIMFLSVFHSSSSHYYYSFFIISMCVLLYGSPLALLFCSYCPLLMFLCSFFLLYFSCVLFCVLVICFSSFCCRFFFFIFFVFFFGLLLLRSAFFVLLRLLFMIFFFFFFLLRNAFSLTSLFVIHCYIILVLAILYCSSFSLCSPFVLDLVNNSKTLRKVSDGFSFFFDVLRTFAVTFIHYDNLILIFCFTFGDTSNTIILLSR